MVNPLSGTATISPRWSLSCSALLDVVILDTLSNLAHGLSFSIPWAEKSESHPLQVISVSIDATPHEPLEPPQLPVKIQLVSERQLSHANFASPQ